MPGISQQSQGLSEQTEDHLHDYEAEIKSRTDGKRAAETGRCMTVAQATMMMPVIVPFMIVPFMIVPFMIVVVVVV